MQFGILYLMMTDSYLYSEIFSRFGTVQRARGCFLYTKKGVRLTDLYQEGGRAVLGWGGTAFTRFKNVLNRGITGSYITEFEVQTQKAVAKLLNSPRTVLFYPSYASALKAALTVSPNGTVFYKPWNPAESDFSGQDCVIIAPPLPWTQTVYIVAAIPEVVEVALAAGRTVPVSERIPAPLNAAVARALFDLAAELPRRSEKDWFLYDNLISAYWERKGPYLFPKVLEEQYKSFVLHCLDCALVISPDYNTPSIVPFGADRGVFSKLKQKPFDTGSSSR